PGACDDAGSIARADFGFVSINQSVEGGAIPPKHVIPSEAPRLFSSAGMFGESERAVRGCGHQST
ncbi:hypothetical protein, partial [Pseudomonas sp. GW460-R15]|uniref:hypothetical protein n=1 Tax=Pseudomonas sp. GW460-R15 TaxID=2075557 RepID=UPI001C4486B3